MTRLASSCIPHYLTKEIVIRYYKMRLLKCHQSRDDEE